MKTRGLLFRVLGSVWPGVLSLPPETQNVVEYTLRKTGHVSEYAVLAALLFRAFRATRPLDGRIRLWAWLAAVAYAASDEWHQSFTPSRTATPKDVAWDAAGALLGVGLAAAWAAWAAKRRGRADAKGAGEERGP